MEKEKFCCPECEKYLNNLGLSSKHCEVICKIAESGNRAIVRKNKDSIVVMEERATTVYPK